MTRYIVLGNGNILICLDKDAQIRDLYFPYVGQENHVNGKFHKLGIWCDSHFSWFSSHEWQKKLNYKNETLVSDIQGYNSNLELELTINDCVQHNKNIFIRKVIVKNQINKKRSIRLFFHQNFDIYEANIGDTAYYNPLLQSVIHYKGKRYFLMNGFFYQGSSKKMQGISSYATGSTEEKGMLGTYVDAEDGHLSGNTIEHGSVDSVISFDFTLPENGAQTVYYWICIGKNFSEVAELNDIVLDKRPQRLITNTSKHWKSWVNRIPFDFKGLSPKVVNLFKRSLLTVRTHADNGGALIASGDSDTMYFKRDTYAYMWPRDGALISRALDRAGYSDLTEKFFEFCQNSLTPDGYLFHKYRPDGSLGSSWHSWIHENHVQLPIQEDQIALVLDAVWKHYVQHGNKKYIRTIFKGLIRKLSEFMLDFMDEETGLPKESYDLWEEKLGIHTFTCAATYAGFRAAANFEKSFGSKCRGQKYIKAAERLREAIISNFYDPQKEYFIKGLYSEQGVFKKDTTIDASSTYGVFQFGVLDSSDKRIAASIKKIKEKLCCGKDLSGYARYENDMYYRISDKLPGNPWVITTLWLAEYYINIATNEKELQPAIDLFNWVARHSVETGILSEQIHPYTAQPISATPLTWSHAGFVIAINKYLVKLDTLGICKECNPPKLKIKE